MNSVCIYCGSDKSMALHECQSCLKTPTSHVDVIHSIILSYSDDEPHLNFLDIEEIEYYRNEILEGSAITIESELFSLAEEAYSAARSVGGPQAISYFSKLTVPIILMLGLLFLLSALS